MTELLDGRQIVNRYTKMSARPEFYSGRGAVSSDLPQADMEKIYNGVKKHYGDEAAANFCQLVYDTPFLSATAFLNTFYSFVATGCKARKIDKQSDFDVGPDDGGRYGIGMATVFNVLGSSDRADESESIRNRFLWNHKDEYKPEKKRERELQRSCYWP